MSWVYLLLLALLALALPGALAAGPALAHHLAEQLLEVRQQIVAAQGLGRRWRWGLLRRRGPPQPAPRRAEVFEHGADSPGGLALPLRGAKIRIGEGEELVVFEPSRLEKPSIRIRVRRRSRSRRTSSLSGSFSAPWLMLGSL
jgi:hypothetical protein